MYKALYRQYRPITFDDVYGQETIVKTLQNSIKNRTYGHAYMFFGPRGTGKTSISKIFARSLNCLAPINGNACGKCKNCLNSHQKECVDIIEIDAASNNGVDEIRELKNKISLVPSELKYKVYIIDEVHMLSIGAFNALLKTLEEPPEHVIFILATTDPQKVPETIISRCQCFSFKRISTENIAANLKQICEKEKILIDSDVIDEISYSCDGGMRDALSLLDQLRSYADSQITLNDYANVNGSLTNEEIKKIYNAIFEQNFSYVLSSIRKFNDEGKNIINILEKLMRFMRNEIVNFYLNSTKIDYDINLIHRLVLLINEKMNDIKKSSNPTIYVEMIILEYMNSIKMNFKENKTSDINNYEANVPKFNSDFDTNFKKTNDETFENKENHDNLEEQNSDKKNPQVIDEKIKNNVSEDSDKSSDINEASDICEIENIDEIFKVRVHNTLANANKKLLINEISKMSMFNDYTFDQKIGYIACAILDGKIRAVSDENIIISYEYDSIVKQNVAIINKYIETYNLVTNSNKKIAIVSDKSWEDIRNKYISDLKNGNSYEVMIEPEEVFIEKEKDDIISKNAIDLFGDIVEIN